MPITKCNMDEKPGYRWGKAGTCYPYVKGDVASEAAAKKKATDQGKSIESNKVTMSANFSSSELVEFHTLLSDIKEPVELIEEIMLENGYHMHEGKLMPDRVVLLATSDDKQRVYLGPIRGVWIFTGNEAHKDTDQHLNDCERTLIIGDLCE